MAAKIDNSKQQDLEPFSKPVATREVRVIIIGGAGTGKTILGLGVLKALEKIGCDVVLHEDGQTPQSLAQYTKELTETLPKMASRLHGGINIYTAQTNKAGFVKGLPKVKERKMEQVIDSPYTMKPDEVGGQKCFRITSPTGLSFLVGYKPEPEEEHTIDKTRAEIWTARLNEAFRLGAESRK